MPRLTDLAQQLALLQSRGLLRIPDDGSQRQLLAQAFPDYFIDASSNDYLGLAAGGEDPVSRETFEPGWVAPVSRETPLGAGASRLIHGTHPCHFEVERAVADWLGQPTALLFSSGYAANLGALSALLDRNDLVVSDALNHASLIDGIRLSRAETVVAPHLDLDAVRAALELPTQGARWVVVESYYSMDGDVPDLRALRALCNDHGAYLYVDEAHALGVWGPEGAGLLAEAGVHADVVMAAFGKAVGSHGAAIASSDDVRTWLWNRARSFVFSTAPSPRQTQSLLNQLARARAAEQARARLAQLGERLRGVLGGGGAQLVRGSRGPIVSVLVGTPKRALELSALLGRRGILVQAIRPPTVPAGQCRLRLTLSAGLSDEEIDRLAHALLEELGSRRRPL